MTSIWGELKRRNVVKVAVAYAIVGWLLVQVADTFFPALRLPEWTVTFVAGLVILGLPLALILSWAYELTPDGVERTKSVPLSESIAKITGRKLDFVIIGLMAAGIAFLVVDNYVLDSGGAFAGADVDPGSLDATSDEPPSTVAEPTPAIADEEQREVLPNSVAVLPFENVSPNPDDAYFAIGIHEEILNQLAKLSALNVIARTSMRQYANTEKSIPEIAEELNVETVMEGSVRYAGGLVRITAQLNDGITGTHLWSETYTRDFEDIFAIESDVAMNIANALEAEFSPAEQRLIEERPTNSFAAYALYLRVLSIRRGAQEGGLAAISLLDDAIALDPDFALAYALKASIRTASFVNSVDSRSADASERATLELEIRDLVAKALALDPNATRAHEVLGQLALYNWRWTDALQAYERGNTVGGNASWLNAYMGRREEAIRIGQRRVELDPVSGGAHRILGIAMSLLREHEAAADALRRSEALAPANPLTRVYIGFSEVGLQNPVGALAELQLAEQLMGESRVLSLLPEIAQAYAIIGRDDDARRLFDEVSAVAVDREIGAGTWALAYLAIRDREKTLEWLEVGARKAESHEPDPGFFALMFIRTNVLGDPLLDEPEFVALRNRLEGD